VIFGFVPVLSFDGKEGFVVSIFVYCSFHLQLFWSEWMLSFKLVKFLSLIIRHWCMIVPIWHSIWFHLVLVLSNLSWLYFSVLVSFCFWFISVFVRSTVDLSRRLFWFGFWYGFIPYWFCLVCLGLIHIGFRFLINFFWFWFWVFISVLGYCWPEESIFSSISTRIRYCYCFWFCLILVWSWFTVWYFDL